MFVPRMLLRRLYTFGSLENTEQGVRFSLKNRLKDASFTQLQMLKIDGKEVPHEAITLHFGGDTLQPDDLAHSTPVDFPLRSTLHILSDIEAIEAGQHVIELSFRSLSFGTLGFTVEDTLSDEEETALRIPRDEKRDYSEDIIQKRQAFVEEYAGQPLKHINQYSFPPEEVRGNVENFTGVAQVPLGFAGPLTVNGEHAQGDFLIPLATSEGTLVASYNRGIKVLNLSGGVTSTVVGDAMQRAPVFVFSNARDGRAFAEWIKKNTDALRQAAESTSQVAQLQYVDPYLSNQFVYLRFNYSTGDAAGQNMVGRATFAACGWIFENYPEDKIQHFYLESNLATDKKSSQINMMRPRGKRVTAEAVIERDILVQCLRVDPATLNDHGNVSTIGAFLSGAHNNGAHSPNAITALFIATGQDVANVAESSSAVLYSEVTDEGHLYVSLTIPSLIVATYGGGTGLATQRECLELMECYGKGKVRKFAEIVAGVALAGELSLGAAISSSDWVASHESYGRNR